MCVKMMNVILTMIVLQIIWAVIASAVSALEGKNGKIFLVASIIDLSYQYTAELVYYKKS